MKYKVWVILDVTIPDVDIDYLKKENPNGFDEERMVIETIQDALVDDREVKLRMLVSLEDANSEVPTL